MTDANLITAMVVMIPQLLAGHRLGRCAGEVCPCLSGVCVVPRRGHRSLLLASDCKWIYASNFLSIVAIHLAFQ